MEFDEKIRPLCLHSVPSNIANKSFFTGEGDNKYSGCLLEVFKTPLGAVKIEQEYGDISYPERMSYNGNFLLDFVSFFSGVVGSESIFKY